MHDDQLPTGYRLGTHATARLDDELLASLYIRMWELLSGRTFPSHTPPEQATEEELISFWADDLPSRLRPALRAAPACGGQR